MFNIFKFRWLRRAVRRNTMPIPKEEAVEWKDRLAKIYAFLAFNVVGIILLTSWSKGLDIVSSKNSNEAPEKKYARLLRGGNDIQVVKVRGTTIVDNYKISKDEL